MNRLTAFFFALVLSALSTTPALADTYTYTYTGNDFTSLSITSSYPGFSNLYTTSDFVSGSFTVSAALAPNLDLATITVGSASFMDGVQTLSTQAGTAPSTYVQISTDSSGDITSWGVILQDGESDIATSDALVYDDILRVWYDAIGDSATNMYVAGGGTLWIDRSASNTDKPGTWTMTDNPSPAAAPEPSSLLLLGTSLLGTAGVLCRRLTA